MILMGGRMTSCLFNAEMPAPRSLLDLYEQAEECRTLFERANIALPEVLKRVLGMNGTGAKQTSQPIIPPPEKPPVPPELTGDWTCISGDLNAHNRLVPAYLRAV